MLSITEKRLLNSRLIYSNIGTIDTVGTVGTIDTVGTVGAIDTVGTVGAIDTVGSTGTIDTVDYTVTVGTVGSTGTFFSGDILGTFCSDGSLGTYISGGSIGTFCSGGSIGTFCSGGSIGTFCSGGSIGTFCGELVSPLTLKPFVLSTSTFPTKRGFSEVKHIQTKNIQYILLICSHVFAFRYTQAVATLSYIGVEQRNSHVLCYIIQLTNPTPTST